LITFLCIAAATAGFFDAIAGGGGLIQLPALLVGMSDKPVVQALGTNKFASIFGTSNAANRYRKGVKTNPRVLASMMMPAFIGSMFGAQLASHVPTAQMRKVVLGALILIFIYTALNPKLGHEENIKINYWITGGAGLAIGFYDGIFGPGTGTFLMAILVGVLGYGFLHASAIAKFTNVATNLSAILVFAKHGAIIWGVGIALAISNVIGSYFGSHMAIKGGSPLVRKVFLLMTGALIAKVGYDVLR
jgi:uncharacterized membrane protein YfcA